MRKVEKQFYSVHGQDKIIQYPYFPYFDGQFQQMVCQIDLSKRNSRKNQKQHRGTGKLVKAAGDTCKEDEKHRNGFVIPHSSQVKLEIENLTNTVSYIGQWKNGEKHGNGKEIFVDGSRYEGQYEEGKKQGKGKLVYANGTKYEGQFLQNCYHGYGIEIGVDRMTYRGEWNMNQMHGQGIRIWPDGRSYEGFFKNNQEHGQGTYSWSDGSKYMGEWQSGLYHGKGTIVTSNGTARQGQWKSGGLVTLFKENKEYPE